jgi:hypothetical protein
MTDPHDDLSSIAHPGSMKSGIDDRGGQRQSRHFGVDHGRSADDDSGPGVPGRPD